MMSRLPSSSLLGGVGPRKAVGLVWAERNLTVQGGPTTNYCGLFSLLREERGVVHLLACAEAVDRIACDSFTSTLDPRGFPRRMSESASADARRHSRYR